MKKEIYKGFIWLGMAVVIIFTPLARGGMTVWAVMSALSIVYLLIFAWLVKSTHKFQSTAIDIPLLLLAILAVISFAFSIYKYASFNALLSLFAFIGIYYLIVNNFDKVMVRRLITLVICLGTGLSIYGLLQYFGYLDHSWWRHDNFLTASYINHNHFAGLLELVIPVSFAMLLTRRRKKAVVIVSALIIMITAFVFAQSRGAWLSLGVSLFVMTVILVNKKIIPMRSIFIFLIVVTLLISFAYFNGGFVSERIDSIGDIAKGKDSLFMRLKIWDGTTNLILHNPLIGTGIGTFVWALPGYRPEGLNVRARFAHNDYLHMPAEMGFLALPLMILILLRVIGTGLGYYKKEGRIDELKLGCAIGILSLSLHGFIDFNFHIPANMILVCIYAGIVMGAKEC